MRAGARVIMTGRNPNRLAAARAALRRRVPDAAPELVETLLLDTSNLGSVRAAAASAAARANASTACCSTPASCIRRRRARPPCDGHEVVFATNVLGHFALAGELLTTLAAASGRMVWVGSMSTALTPYDPVDPQLDEGYSAWRAYVQSKVATTALGFEADRRLRAAGVAGGERRRASRLLDERPHAGHRAASTRRRRGTRFADNLQAAITQSKEHGAWPLVRALVDPSVEGGEFWGPRTGRAASRDARRRAKITRDLEIAARLWRACEDATGVRWPFEKAARALVRARDPGGAPRRVRR